MNLLDNLTVNLTPEQLTEIIEVRIWAELRRNVKSVEFKVREELADRPGEYSRSSFEGCVIILEKDGEGGPKEQKGSDLR